MKDELISFEVAQLAINKGCNIFILLNEWSYIDDNGDEFYCNYEPIDCGYKYKQHVDCTQSLLQRWLREEHNIHIAIDHGILCNKWSCYIYKTINSPDILWGSEFDFKTHEEALEEGLKQGLGLINNK